MSGGCFSDLHALLQRRLHVYPIGDTNPRQASAKTQEVFGAVALHTIGRYRMRDTIECCGIVCDVTGIDRCHSVDVASANLQLKKPVRILHVTSSPNRNGHL